MTKPTKSATAKINSENIETLVFVRHGEKPGKGLGLLNCKGLNRSLKLPDFFADNFPPADYIFAPNPSLKTTEIHGDGQRYDYIRPLLTIGPTAVKMGVPVNTQLPYNDPGLLADTLLESKYHNAIVYLCWEHMDIVEFTTAMLRRFGKDEKVPVWDNNDYDMVFVFTIDWNVDPPVLNVKTKTQNPGPLEENCP